MLPDDAEAFEFTEELVEERGLPRQEAQIRGGVIGLAGIQCWNVIYKSARKLQRQKGVGGDRLNTGPPGSKYWSATQYRFLKVSLFLLPKWSTGS